MSVKHIKKNKNNKVATTHNERMQMFGYKSAFLIGVGSIVFLFLGAYVDGLLGFDNHIVHAVIGGVGSGFTLAFARYFIESKKGVCRGFWLTGSIASILIILFVLAYFILNLAF